jgi:transcriptional regulator with XRE-family HTH domain
VKNDKLRDSIYSEKHLQFRKLLVSARKSLNLSQKALSEILGVHHSMIGKIEIGDRRLDLLEFLNYCKALKISPNKVITEIENQ